MATFKSKTINQVILPLEAKLKKMAGHIYPSLGHFYREIEILKFPHMARYTTPRNMYDGNQYFTVVKYLEENGYIKVQPHPTHKNWYQVLVTGQTSTTSTTTTPESITPESIIPEKIFIADMELYLVNNTGTAASNCYELALPAGEGLSAKELKKLNQAGLVYHSEQTDIDFETDNGVEYFDIYYFAKVDNTVEFFQDCIN